MIFLFDISLLINDTDTIVLLDTIILQAMQNPLFLNNLTYYLNPYLHLDLHNSDLFKLIDIIANIVITIASSQKRKNTLTKRYKTN